MHCNVIWCHSVFQQQKLSVCIGRGWGHAWGELAQQPSQVKWTNHLIELSSQVNISLMEGTTLDYQTVKLSNLWNFTVYIVICHWMQTEALDWQSGWPLCMAQWQLGRNNGQMRSGSRVGHLPRRSPTRKRWHWITPWENLPWTRQFFNLKSQLFNLSPTILAYIIMSSELSTHTIGVASPCVWLACDSAF